MGGKGWVKVPFDLRHRTLNPLASQGPPPAKKPGHTDYLFAFACKRGTVSYGLDLDGDLHDVHARLLQVFLCVVGAEVRPVFHSRYLSLCCVYFDTAVIALMTAA
jgi:hypothetical protein